MSNALYELALNQDIQKKLREEINTFCAKNNKELKYDDIKEMEYLDKVFKGMSKNKYYLKYFISFHFSLRMGFTQNKSKYEE